MWRAGGWQWGTWRCRASLPPARGALPARCTLHLLLRARISTAVFCRPLCIMRQVDMHVGILRARHVRGACRLGELALALYLRTCPVASCFPTDFSHAVRRP